MSENVPASLRNRVIHRAGLTFRRLLVGACATLLTLSSVQAQTGASPSLLVRAVIRSTADRAIASRFGTIIDDYGSFLTLSLSPASAGQARAAGLDFEPLDQRIGIGTFRFDPAVAPPVLQSRFAEITTGSEPRYWLIQFRGPIRDGWLASLQASGIGTVQYAGNHAVLARATPMQIATATRLPIVRSASPYHPAYKLSADLEWLLGKPIQRIQGTRERYLIGVFRNENVAAVVDELVRLGGKVEQREDVEGLYFRVLVVELDTDRLADIASLRAVCRIETWNPRTVEDESSAQVVAGNYFGTTTIAPNYSAFLTSHGVDGTGITVAIADDGVDGTEVHVSGRVTDSEQLRRGVAAGSGGHGQHCAGIVAGQCNHPDANGFFYAAGMAPNANLLNIPIVSGSYTGTDADAAADTVSTAGGNGQTGSISSNSWGFAASNAYGAHEAEYDAFVQDASTAMPGLQPLTIVFSSGNSGPAAGSLTGPKAAKNIIVVGATEGYRPSLSSSATCGVINADNLDEVPCFSSRGPTNDGRIRPDVVAPGTWIASARAGSNPLAGNIDAEHRYSSGSSAAAPHVAGAIALIQQWWKAGHAGQLPSPALSKAILINGAVDPAADPAGTIPNNTEGWGRVSLANAFDSASTIYNDQATVLTNPGQTFTVAGNVVSLSRPFRVTLVWTDPPAAAGSNPALVNDLDLEVEVNGTVYKGNVFAGGVSTTGGTADNRNNVECAYFEAQSGSFVVTVRAAALGGDGARDAGDGTDQHFALVISNAEICTTPVPPTPVATAFSSSRIDVSWSAVANATSYKVYRSTVAGGPYSLAGSVATSPFQDTTVTAPNTYSYVVRAVGTCTSLDSAETSATIVPLVPPSGVLATISGPTSVSLSWTAVPEATLYRVLRTSNNSDYSDLGTSASLSFLDTTATSDTSYLYRLRAIDASGNESSSGNRVLATTVVLTDPVLQPGITTMKTAHISELRTAVNAVRAISGLGAFAFTDPVLTPGMTVLRLHVSELRDALDAGRAAIGLSPASYTDSVITPGVTPIRAVHLSELRLASGTTPTP